MTHIPELDIEVENVDRFNDEASEILTTFCEDLEGQGDFTVASDDSDSYLWTNNAIQLIEAEINRLYSIGKMYFDEADLDISTLLYIEVE